MSGYGNVAAQSHDNLELVHTIKVCISRRFETKSAVCEQSHPLLLTTGGEQGLRDTWHGLSSHTLLNVSHTIYAPLTVTTLAKGRDGVKRLVPLPFFFIYSQYCKVLLQRLSIDPMRRQTCHPLEPSSNTGPSRLSLNTLQIMLDCYI